MKWLINYLRQCFCKHEWELLQATSVYSEFDDKPCRYEHNYICRKCMAHKKIKC